MAIPDFQSVMLPLMRYCADGKEHAISETTDALAAQFKLTDEERKALLSSGVQEIFRNRVIVRGNSLVPMLATPHGQVNLNCYTVRLVPLQDQP